jgi:hypothetical protein
MLVRTCKTRETVVINDRVMVVVTNLMANEAAIGVSASEPFDARRGNELAKTDRGIVHRANYEFALKPSECIVIDDTLTLIFFTARIPEGETEPKARFGFESSIRTTIKCRNAAGAVVREYEIGPELSDQL